MRSYSSAVMLCAASTCGVTATGEGTTAEEAEVITVIFIVAWSLLRARCLPCLRGPKTRAEAVESRAECGFNRRQAIRPPAPHLPPQSRSPQIKEVRS